jgi:hypothetical protein
MPAFPGQLFAEVFACLLVCTGLLLCPLLGSLVTGLYCAEMAGTLQSHSYSPVLYHNILTK